MAEFPSVADNLQKYFKCEMSSNKTDFVIGNQADTPSFGQLPSEGISNRKNESLNQVCVEEHQSYHCSQQHKQVPLHICVSCGDAFDGQYQLSQHFQECSESVQATIRMVDKKLNQSSEVKVLSLCDDSTQSPNDVFTLCHHLDTIISRRSRLDIDKQSIDGRRRNYINNMYNSGACINQLESSLEFSKTSLTQKQHSNDVSHDHMVQISVTDGQNQSVCDKLHHTKYRLSSASQNKKIKKWQRIDKNLISLSVSGARDNHLSSLACYSNEQKSSEFGFRSCKINNSDVGDSIQNNNISNSGSSNVGNCKTADISSENYQKHGESLEFFQQKLVHVSKDVDMAVETWTGQQRRGQIGRGVNIFTGRGQISRSVNILTVDKCPENVDRDHVTNCLSRVNLPNIKTSNDFVEDKSSDNSQTFSEGHGTRHESTVSESHGTRHESTVSESHGTRHESTVSESHGTRHESTFSESHGTRHQYKEKKLQKNYDKISQITCPSKISSDLNAYTADTSSQYFLKQHHFPGSDVSSTTQRLEFSSFRQYSELANCCQEQGLYFCQMCAYHQPRDSPCPHTMVICEMCVHHHPRDSACPHTMVVCEMCAHHHPRDSPCPHTMVVCHHKSTHQLNQVATIKMAKETGCNTTGVLDVGNCHLDSEKSSVISFENISKHFHYPLDFSNNNNNNTSPSHAGTEEMTRDSNNEYLYCLQPKDFSLNLNSGLGSHGAIVGQKQTQEAFIYSQGSESNRTANSTRKDMYSLSVKQKDISRQDLSCSICSRVFTYHSALITHMQTHSIPFFTYQCQLCLQYFGHTTELKVHVCPNAIKKPFTCPNCDQKFAKRIHLNRHLVTHSGVKPYPCWVCGKRFRRSDHLKRHTQSLHAGSRQHVCLICGKEFVRKYELNKHNVLHSLVDVIGNYG